MKPSCRTHRHWLSDNSRRSAPFRLDLIEMIRSPAVPLGERQPNDAAVTSTTADMGARSGSLAGPFLLIAVDQFSRSIVAFALYREGRMMNGLGEILMPLSANEAEVPGND